MRILEAKSHILAARRFPGYKNDSEALKLWQKLYLHLPRCAPVHNFTEELLKVKILE